MQYLLLPELSQPDGQLLLPFKRTCWPDRVETQYLLPPELVKPDGHELPETLWTATASPCDTHLEPDELKPEGQELPTFETVFPLDCAMAICGIVAKAAAAVSARIVVRIVCLPFWI